MNFKSQIVVLFCFLTSVLSVAQTDWSVNFIQLISSPGSVNFEKVLNSNTSIDFNLGVFGKGETSVNTSNADLVVRVSPGMRFYFNTNDDCEGFFMGLYIPYRFTTLSTNYSVFENQFLIEKVYYTRTDHGVAFTLNGGKKWITNSGFFFSVNLGIGRYFINNHSYDSQIAEDHFNSNGVRARAPGTSDLRFGLNLGWRFNKEKGSE